MIHKYIKYLKFIKYDINGAVGIWAVDMRVVVGIANVSYG